MPLARAIHFFADHFCSYSMRCAHIVHTIFVIIMKLIGSSKTKNPPFDANACLIRWLRIGTIKIGGIMNPHTNRVWNIPLDSLAQVIFCLFVLFSLKLGILIPNSNWQFCAHESERKNHSIECEHWISIGYWLHGIEHSNANLIGSTMWLSQVNWFYYFWRVDFTSQMAQQLCRLYLN